MALVMDTSTKTFDTSAIHRGDAIRLRRAGDTVFRNGFVTKTSPQMIEVLYCNVQNNQTSFLQLTAADAAIGAWEVYWTTDFSIISYNPAADSAEGVNAGG